MPKDFTTELVYVLLFNKMALDIRHFVDYPFLKNYFRPQIRKKHEKLKPNSLWDARPSDVLAKKNSKPKIYTCKRQKLFTIRDGKIVEIMGENEDVETTEPGTVDDSQGCTVSENTERICSRLSVDKIKQIPKFQNYDKGTPSQVKYN